MLLKSIVFCAAWTLLASGSGFAQRGGAGQAPTPPSNPGQNRSQYPMGTQDQQQMTDPLAPDRRFVKQATEEAMTQVELGKLAQEKGSSPAVKEFGKRMVEDHGKAINELKLAAAKASLDTASEMSHKARKAHDKLAKLSGPDFDRAYAKMTINDHKSEVKEFDREAHKGNAPEVKEYAAKALATHHEHLKMAERLEGGN